MLNHQTPIECFLHEYERIFNEALSGNINPAATANFFAGCFIASNPKEINCGMNNEAFIVSILKTYQYYIQCKVCRMNIIFQHIIPLNECNVVNKVTWQATYENQENLEEIIEFEVIYFIQKLNNQFLIYGYITPDEEKAFREKGILPHNNINKSEEVQVTRLARKEMLRF